MVSTNREYLMCLDRMYVAYSRFFSTVCSPRDVDILRYLRSFIESCKSLFVAKEHLLATEANGMLFHIVKWIESYQTRDERAFAENHFFHFFVFELQVAHVDPELWGVFVLGTSPGQVLCTPEKVIAARTLIDRKMASLALKKLCEEKGELFDSFVSARERVQRFAAGDVHDRRVMTLGDRVCSLFDGKSPPICYTTLAMMRIKAKTPREKLLDPGFYHFAPIVNHDGSFNVVQFGCHGAEWGLLTDSVKSEIFRLVSYCGLIKQTCGQMLREISRNYITQFGKMQVFSERLENVRAFVPYLTPAERGEFERLHFDFASLYYCEDRLSDLNARFLAVLILRAVKRFKEDFSEKPSPYSISFTEKIMSVRFGVRSELFLLPRVVPPVTGFPARHSVYAAESVPHGLMDCVTGFEYIPPPLASPVIVPVDGDRSADCRVPIPRSPSVSSTAPSSVTLPRSPRARMLRASFQELPDAVVGRVVHPDEIGLDIV